MTDVPRLSRGGKGIVDWVNLDKLEDLLRDAAVSTPQIGRALKEEADLVFAKSQELVPVGETGNLMGSGMVHQPAFSRGDVYVEITYGGAAARYAGIQHEKDFRHAPGKQRKFLEQAVKEAAPDMQF